MQEDRVEQKIVASAASCPMPGCAALAVAYKPSRGARRADLFDTAFVCPRCGVEFYSAEDDLVFQAVPEVWLRAGVYQA